MTKASPVMSVIVRKFRAADEETANEILVRAEKSLETWPGFLGIHHNHSATGDGSSLATVISFKTLDDLIAWEQSDRRKQLVEDLSQYVVGEVVKNRLWNLNSLLGDSPPPKKWKAVLVLTFWVLVVRECLSWAADILSPDFPTGSTRIIVLLVINILLNSYIFLPKSMEFLHRYEDSRREKKKAQS